MAAPVGTKAATRGTKPVARAQPIYTEEKAVHLVNVFIAILSFMILIGWLEIMLLTPLRLEKIEMAHMDPSEIIVVPFSLQKLSFFTIFPVVIVMGSWMVRTPDRVMGNILSLLKLTLSIYALLGLCGDNIIKHWQHSSTAALFVATLLSTTWTGKKTSNIVEELPFNDFSDLLAISRLYCMLLVSIPFHILSVLDRGFQIQRWPLPIILGVTYGYVIGTLVGICFMYLVNKGKGKKK